MRIAALVLVSLALTAAVPARAARTAPRVLILWDAQNQQTQALIDGLTGAGLEATLGCPRMPVR